MAAIIRVKRRNSVEPQDALLIACKRSKIYGDTDDDEPLTTLVKLAGTVKSQDEDVMEHVAKQFASKKELQEQFKKHKVDILSKMRDEAKAHSRESRYKIINCQRSLDDNHVDHNNPVTTVIDIEDSESINKDDKKDDNYVYDIYFDTVIADKELSLDEQIAIYPIESELVFDNDPNYEAEEEDVYKTDDENSENNWRNDYPDESEPESIDEDDMKLAMENLSIGDELSSEEDFAYGLNEDDVNNYGYRYAKYKAKVKRELGEDSEYESEEESKESSNDSYEYDDDSEKSENDD